jgi:hypothetical protein
MTGPVVGENLPVGRYRAQFRVLDATGSLLTTETQRFGTPRLATSWLLYTALTRSSLPHLRRDPAAAAVGRADTAADRPTPTTRR